MDDRRSDNFDSELNDRYSSVQVTQVDGSVSRHPISRRSFLGGMAAIGAISFIGASSLSGCTQCSTTDTPAPQSTAYDLIIVGSGGAGLSAAISAHDNGVKNIIVLEKMSVNGGNTNYSSSGMNASETKFQAAQGIVDSNALFAEETFDGGKKTANRELVDYMCDHSAGGIDWLDGMDIVLDNITQLGGMSVKRCHRPTDGTAVGLVLVPGLLAEVKKKEIQVVVNSEVKSLLRDSGGTVTGVSAQEGTKEVTYDAKAVILATGGLGANQEMIIKYRPDLEGYVTTNQAGTTGDGYVMAEEAGAELIQMDQIQIHPTVEQSTSTLIAEGIRGTGAILVNDKGLRFFNELETRDKVSASILAQTGKFAWLVFDQEVYDENKAIAKYDTSGLVVKGTSIADLASKLAIDPTTLQTTIDTYNNLSSGQTDEFGRTESLIVFSAGNMYAIKVAPGVHHSMGGIKINTKCEALRADGTHVGGLYAAGEVTGGIHGDNRLGGNAVCDIIVNGKNVGEVVAKALA
jgi:fumarate reductase flavoprotein subunit